MFSLSITSPAFRACLPGVNKNQPNRRNDLITTKRVRLPARGPLRAGKRPRDPRPPPGETCKVVALATAFVTLTFA